MATGNTGEAQTRARPSAAPWWLELAKIAGETVGRASVKFAPRSPRPTRSTAALVRELSALVQEHGDEEPAKLQDEPRFWALVDRLHARHRQRGYARRETVPEQARATDGTRADEVADGEVVESGAAEPEVATQATEPEATEAKASETADSETADSETADAETADAETAEDAAAGTDAAEPRSEDAVAGADAAEAEPRPNEPDSDGDDTSPREPDAPDKPPDEE